MISLKHSKFRKNVSVPITVILGVALLCFILHSSSWLNLNQLHPIDREFQIRREHLQEICAKYPGEARESTMDKLNRHLNSSPVVRNAQPIELSGYQMQHMLVDHDHQVLYCYVPKVGCTNWKKIFIILSGRSAAKEPLQIRSSYAHTENFQTLKDLSVPDRIRVLKEYKKFLFVRHPMERVLSAFRNKFEGSSPWSIRFQETYGQRIIRRFRPNADFESLATGRDVTFEEFIRYLMEPEASVQFNNWRSYQEHWEPISGLCSPCAVQYDYIGVFENLVEESNFILKKFSEGIEYPQTSHVHTSDTTSHMASYYARLPAELVRGLERVFEMDFLLFNYTTVGN